MASYDIDKIDIKPGDPVRAQDFMAVVEAVRNPMGVARGGQGVYVRQGPRGQVQITGKQPLAFVGVANGDIPARSGTAWGKGSVTRYGFDGTNDYSIGINYDVLNPSSNTMTGGAGITSGKYCFVQENSQGRLIVAPLECS